MLIEWDKLLETGNAKIDEDHRHIIDMVNAIWVRMDAGVEHAVMEDMMLDYCNYCSRHFQLEENLMIEHRYLNYKFHRSRHKLMLDEFESLMLRLEVAKEISSDQLRFFVKMLAEHIQSEDKKLAAFIQESLTQAAAATVGKSR